MKLFFKLLIALSLMMIAAPFFIKGPGNKPVMTLDKLADTGIALPKLPDITSLPKKIGHKITSIMPGSDGKKMKVYKWKDEKGVWHFSDKENPDGASEIMHVESIVDTVKFDPKAEPDKPADTTGKTAPKPLGEALNDGGISPLTIPYTQVPKLIEEAREVRKKLEGRYIEQGKILDSN